MTHTPYNIQAPAIHIDPAAGGVSLFVPIEAEELTSRSYQELLIRMQQALLSYLMTATAEQLPIIV